MKKVMKKPTREEINQATSQFLASGGKITKREVAEEPFLQAGYSAGYRVPRDEDPRFNNCPVPVVEDLIYFSGGALYVL